MRNKRPTPDPVKFRFSDENPPAPSGGTNVKWQKTWPYISAYLPSEALEKRDIVVFDPPLGSPPTVAPEIVFFQDADGNSHVLWFTLS